MLGKKKESDPTQYLKRAEIHVSLYLSQLNPGISEVPVAEARTLEVSMDKLATQLLECFDRFEPFNSNVRVGDALRYNLSVPDHHGYFSGLIKDLWTLKAALKIARQNAPPAPRGRPVHGPDLNLVQHLATEFTNLIKRPPSKSPGSIFHRSTLLILEYAGQPRSDIRELIGTVINKPKKR